MTAYRIRIYRPSEDRQVHAQSFNEKDDTEATDRAALIYQHWCRRNGKSAHGTEFKLYKLCTSPIRWDRVMQP